MLDRLIILRLCQWHIWGLDILLQLPQLLKNPRDLFLKFQTLPFLMPVLIVAVSLSNELDGQSYAVCLTLLFSLDLIFH